jgi:hypothetical protein
LCKEFISDPAEQHFPSGDIKVVITFYAESNAKHRDKKQQHHPEQVLPFPGKEILAIKHNGKILFTKFTFLFTIQISQAEKYQSRFAESIR